MIALAEASSTNLLDLGAAGLLVFVTLAFIKVLLKVLAYMREDREKMDGHCLRHHDQIEAFTRTMSNHVEHNTQSTDAMTNAVKELTKIVKKNLE